MCGLQTAASAAAAGPLLQLAGGFQDSTLHAGQLYSAELGCARACRHVCAPERAHRAAGGAGALHTGGGFGVTGRVEGLGMVPARCTRGATLG